MKARIEVKNDQACICFIPEVPVEAEELKKFVEFNRRHSLIFCRGFQYMRQDVEFLVQSGADPR